MKILYATSEAVPFAKTGGLADVGGALPRELSALGHDVAVIMPAYRQALQCGEPLEPTGVRLLVPIGTKRVGGRVLRSQLPVQHPGARPVPVYLIEQKEYFDRPELYQRGGSDFIDNCERFVFFCRAVLETVRQLEWPIDVLHANDWQTGLIPAYIEIEGRHTFPGRDTATIFTIHNLSYQGKFWHWDMLLTGLDWTYFNWRQLEFYGHLNLLKTGLVFSDGLTTVSCRPATTRKRFRSANRAARRPCRARLVFHRGTMSR
jgi:starch synthase